MTTLSDYDFDLPETLIALRPAHPRSSSRMLVAGATITDSVVRDLPTFLRPGDLLVFNNTKVIPARLFGERHRVSAHGTGIAHIGITLIERLTDARWRALVKPAKRLRIGEDITIGPALTASVSGLRGGEAVLDFSQAGDALDTLIETLGQMPLPPYIAAKRPADAQDRIDYQTVFARETGAVAAPTASLHFDKGLLAALKARGVNSTEVTLHVGAGTFLPVKVENIDDHEMHSEWGEVSPESAEVINRTLANGGRVIPVGTTAARLVETAALRENVIGPWSGDTNIFIRPGYEFKIASGLMTNFHLPKSTLMMLVSALMGPQQIREIYAHAISEKYRFFSYGDSSLLLPQSDV